MEMFPFSAIHYISGLDIWGDSKKKKKVDFKRNGCCFSCMNNCFWLVILETSWLFSSPVEEGAVCEQLQAAFLAFQVPQRKKPAGVVEVSCWVIGHMNILVLPDSSDVAAVAVHMGMAWHRQLLEV